MTSPQVPSSGATEALIKAMKSEIDRILEAQAALEAEKLEWAKMANKLEAVQLPEKVKLDIGGQIFATSISVLTKIPDSFFAAMLSGRWGDKRDADGCFFIDRDPSVFGMVIQFLREYPNNKLVVTALSPLQRQQLKDDAEYYHLDDLLKLFTRYVSAYLCCFHSLIISSNANHK